ncbi:MAG: sigma-70 family RNA polymerase sigma factor [Sedimentisphaerales bacterium]|nr:sigma-70 family RNA polymerase sigma factor [Sedimentisphaerales bacterium]
MVDAIGENELLKASLDGNREAFGAIVGRYQTLVCAITYSAIGDVGKSEELAQETFIRAWCNLRQLQDTSRFRAWLCTIARNLAYASIRGGGRDVIDGAGPLDSAEAIATTTPEPSQAATDNERREMVWAAVRRVPRKYREPLVLFYHQQQSIGEVAADLGLSESVVRQRLHRGRRLIKAEVSSLVEDTLVCSGPGKTFAVAVVAALPAMATSTASGAVAGIAAKSVPAAKMLAAGSLAYAVLGATVGLLVDLLFGDVLGLRLAMENPRSPRERRLRIRLFIVWWLVFFVLLVLPLTLLYAGLIPAWALMSCLAVYLILQLALLFCMKASQQRRQIEPPADPPTTRMNRAMLYGGVGGGIFGATGPLLVQAWLGEDWVSLGAIAACDILVFFVATRVYMRIRQWS